MKRKILIFSLLVGIGILFGKNVFGLVEIAENTEDPLIVSLSTPLPNQTFSLGDIVVFDGYFKVAACSNGLFFNKVTFYLTEDKDMPIKKVNACYDCLGAKSSATTTEACNTWQCENVRIIDEEKASILGYKFYKMGTLYPPDSPGVGAMVYYHGSFQIPSNICTKFGFSTGKNKIRFYIQISALHWDHWDWNISYQPGYIVCPPPSPPPSQPSPPSSPPPSPPHSNHPPVANAGEDRIIEEGSLTFLDGSRSYDPDGDPLTYQWSSWGGGEIVSPNRKVTAFRAPLLREDERYRDIFIFLTVTDPYNASDKDDVIIRVKKAKRLSINLTSDLTTDWIWQTKPLTLTWDSENASECRRWIEIWNPFENVKLKDTSLGDKIPYDNWTSDWNDQLSGTITTYPGSGPPDPQTGSQPRNWIGKLWINKIECKDNSGNTKEAEVQVNVKPRPIWQEVLPF